MGSWGTLYNAAGVTHRWTLHNCIRTPVPRQRGWLRQRSFIIAVAVSPYCGVSTTHSPGLEWSIEKDNREGWASLNVTNFLRALCSRCCSNPNERGFVPASGGLRFREFLRVCNWMATRGKSEVLVDDCGLWIVEENIRLRSIILNNRRGLR